MHGGQGARAGSLLRLRGSAAVGAFGTGKDAAGGEDQHVAVRELLFQLARQALLDLVEARKEGNGHEDDDGFFAVADFNLLGMGGLISFGGGDFRRMVPRKGILSEG